MEIFKEKAESCNRFSILKGAPAKICEHLCQVNIGRDFIQSPSCCPALYHLRLANILLSIGAPRKKISSSLMLRNGSGMKWNGSMGFYIKTNGFHAENAYSTWGRTRALKAVYLISLFLVLIFLLTKPSVLLAVPLTLCLCWFKERLLPMSTPKYLELETDSRTWPCKWYSADKGDLPAWHG